MTDPSKELFDHYQTYYEAKRLADQPLERVQTLRLDRLPRWIDRIPRDAHILDAGCATGYLLSLLHAYGYTRLSGVDVSAQLIDAARCRLPEQVSVHLADIHDFLAQAADGSFDVILFHHVLEHIPRTHTIALLREFRRCLSPGGYLSVKVPNALSLGAGYACFVDFTHVVHFNEKALLQVAEAAGFIPECCTLVLHPPRLFWSWRHVNRVLLRGLNRMRWHLNNGMHRLLYRLIDVHPMPKVFENEIELLAQK
ncbi:MAG: class I SAM-dependent methyltransferase [Acidiferrobacterales bacterium]